MDDANDAAETEKSRIIQYSQSSSPLHPPTLNSKIKVFCVSLKTICLLDCKMGQFGGGGSRY